MESISKLVHSQKKQKHLFLDAYKSKMAERRYFEHEKSVLPELHARHGKESVAERCQKAK